MRVKDAWLYASDDELSTGDGENLSAVIYLERYENDRLSTSRDDHIYGHSRYDDQWMEYW